MSHDGDPPLEVQIETLKKLKADLAFNYECVLVLWDLRGEDQAERDLILREHIGWFLKCDLLEVQDDGETPNFLHSPTCGGYCEYACSSTGGEDATALAKGDLVEESPKNDSQNTLGG